MFTENIFLVPKRDPQAQKVENPWLSDVFLIVFMYKCESSIAWLGLWHPHHLQFDLDNSKKLVWTLLQLQYKRNEDEDITAIVVHLAAVKVDDSKTETVCGLHLPKQK